jgi:excisionase family DNA binding protein
MAVEQLMTLHEVSEMLRVPEATLYGWRYRGDGPPSYKVGRHVRYSRSGVLSWLESQRSSGDAE